jgi:hypothetical protein
LLTSTVSRSPLRFLTRIRPPRHARGDAIRRA